MRKEFTVAGSKPQPNMYHPLDRHMQILEGEAEVALILRKLGYGLVIVQTPPSGEVEDAFKYWSPRSVPITRWSVTQDSELFPPVYLGYAYGDWYSMSMKDETVYRKWCPEE